MDEGTAVQVVPEKPEAVMLDDDICKKCPLYAECIAESPNEVCDVRAKFARRMERAVARADGRSVFSRMFDHSVEKRRAREAGFRQRAFEETQDDVLKHFTLTEAYETVLKRVLLETPRAIYDAKKMKVLEAQKTVLMNCIREYDEFEEREEDEEE